MTREALCRLDELTVGKAAPAEVAGVRLAVVRVADREVYAVADECTHGLVALSEGDVDGCALECWLHGSKFDLRTGVPQSPPATVPVATYPVEIDGDQVYVTVSEEH